MNKEKFIGKWVFDYWIESNDTTLLEIMANGIAITSEGTSYKWEPLSNDGIHIFIEGYVDYIGFLRNDQITGEAISDYSMNKWTWKATPWNGPVVTPISKSDVENKRWKVLNSTDEMQDFLVMFGENGSLTTSSFKNENWCITDGKLAFTYANNFINYTEENIDDILKGHAKSKTCIEWDFILEFIEDFVEKSPSPISRSTLNEYKEDKDIILQYLKSNHVEFFYHFTDISNIPKIKQYGGLFSWDYIQKNGLNIPKQGGGELSKRLDKQYRLEDYVRLSFCKYHPMSHVCKTSRGMNLVLLKIKIDVATLKETRFSDRNATQTGHKQGPTFTDLQRVSIAATQKRYVRKDDPDFSFHQAEIMVKRHVPIEYIINIDNPDRI